MARLASSKDIVFILKEKLQGNILTCIQESKHQACKI